MVVIRPIEQSDLGTVLAMNEAAVPHVNSIPLAEFERFMDAAAYFRVATLAQDIAGVLVGFEPGAEYGSVNFRWFESTYDSFVYIDRIVVSPEHRGAGIASRLYDDIAGFALGRAPLLTCEVNIQPPNETSMRFHQGQGFRPVGRQHTEGGAKEVSMLAKALER